MNRSEVKLGLSYKCWITTPIGRLQARFVPSQMWDSGFGTVYLGRVYLVSQNGRRAGDGVLFGRFFADELEPWPFS